jgi:ribonuclease P protein component
MLSKKNRLLTKEFDLVIKTGRETYSPFFSMKCTPAGTLKFSSVAPKKTFKTAVSRNRVRRRIYAAVREILSLKKIKPSHVVLMVKKDIKDIDSPRLVSVLTDLFVQARLIA